MAWPCTCYITLDKLCHLSERQFPHLEHVDVILALSPHSLFLGQNYLGSLNQVSEKQLHIIIQGKEGKWWTERPCTWNLKDTTQQLKTEATPFCYSPASTKLCPSYGARHTVRRQLRNHLITHTSYKSAPQATLSISCLHYIKVFISSISYWQEAQKSSPSSKEEARAENLS